MGAIFKDNIYIKKILEIAAGCLIRNNKSSSKHSYI